MHTELDLILTLTGGLTAALLFGLLAHRLRLSPIVGYLLAGVAVGPFTPGFVAHAGLATQLAEIGVVLLMFGVGLHLDVADLLAVRRVAIPGALTQIAVATALSVLVTGLFGWSLGAGVVFGVAISAASTVLLLRVLGDQGALQTPAGVVAVGWLLVEDLFTVAALVVLPLVAGDLDGRGAGPVAVSLGVAVLKITGLVALMRFVGRRALPALLARVERTGSRELFTLTVLVIALGIAVGSAELFGASMALGAFLAGLAVGQSEFSARAAADALPTRDAFAVLFFVSAGMQFDPRAVVTDAPLIAATLAIVLAGKPLAAVVIMKLLRQPPSTASMVAAALGQIGEFTFIIVGVGRDLGILPHQATQAVVASAVVSIVVNPLFVRLATRIHDAALTSRHAEA
jgi:CPA2 family monovalent cation:H+ antiporter-2